MDPAMVAVEFVPNIETQSVGAVQSSDGGQWASIPQLLSDLTAAFERLQAENVRLRTLPESVVAPGATSVVNEEAASAYQPNGGVSSSSSDKQALPHKDSLVELAVPESPADAKNCVTNPRVILQALPAVAPPDLPTAPPPVARVNSDSLRSSEALSTSRCPSFAGLSLNPVISHHRRTESTACLRAEDAETTQGMIREQWDPLMELELVKAAYVRHGRASTPTAQVSRTGDMIRSSSRLQQFTIHPSSRLIVWWDLLSIWLLSLDVLTTPLAAFGVHVHEEYPWIVAIGAAFWTTDIVLQAFQGYYVNSLVEMRPHKILRRYLRSTAALDVVIVCTDWMYVFARDSSTPLARFFRLQKGARMFRLARILRLLRLVKLVIMFYSLGSAFSAANAVAFFRIVRNVLYIIFFNHFVACSWYAISSLSGDFGYKTWIQELPSELESPAPQKPVSTFYEYTTALHWALTQFTPASMEVHPENPVERLFTICVMLCSLLGFSSVVASMTAIMTQTMAENADHFKRTELLKRFIADHRVSVDLSTRIQTYMGNQKRRLDGNTMLESRVPALQTLPQNLRQDLHTEVSMNVLVKHPLLAELSKCDATGMLHTTVHAMTDEVFLVGAHVWVDDERAERMLFVLRGDFHLFPSGSSSMQWQSAELEPHATEGDMLSEVALWLQWTYSGTLYSISDAEMFSLKAAEFARIMHGGPALRLLFAYARRFQIYAQHDGISTICDVSDMRLMVVQSKMDTGLPVDLWGYVQSGSSDLIKRATETRNGFLKKACIRMATWIAGSK